VSSNSEINILEKLNKNDIDLLIAKNSDFVLVLPLDYIVFSNVVTVNKMTSQLVAGVQQVPNPEFSRLQRELQNAEREYIMAKQQEAYFFRQGQNSGNYGWAALITQAANVAAQIEAGEKAQGFRDQHNSLTASLSTTPMYIDKELFQSYSYDVKNIQSEKKGIFKLIEIRENQFIEKNLELTEKKLFKIANNIEVSDKNYENLKNKFNSLEDITTWENRPLKKVDYKSLVERYNQIDAAKVKTLLDHKELYASLDLSIPKAKKEKSFFSKLFDFGSDERKESNQESKGEDRRFQSVVIVKTSKGLGSGFYVEKNKVITNYHVIENSTSVNIENFNGEKGSAKIIKADKMRDLALLEVNLKGKPVELSSEVLYSGMQVAALGHPSGLSFSMTQGIISSIRKYSTTYDVTGNSNILFVQTDAAINKGNSGGPLFHKNSVIGVNTQGLSKSKTEGLNFAVHVEELKKFLDD
jgi:serine protease Do